MKFTFTGEEFAGTKTTVEFHADSLDDVLNNFKQFLQGSGFVLGMNEVVEVVDRSWEFNNETPFDDMYYPQDSFNINEEEIYVSLDDLEQVEPIPTKKKGKK